MSQSKPRGLKAGLLTGVAATVFLMSALHLTSRASSPEVTGSELPQDAVPHSIVSLPPDSEYFSGYAFYVDKARRTLSVWRAGPRGPERVQEFPADLGKRQGVKLVEGDKRTPEGVYFLLQRLEGPDLDFRQYGSRAFTMDYPNFFDRLDRKTGDGIWLHAVPDDVPLTRGSRGCVVVRNQVIKDLTRFVRLGQTPIIIEDIGHWVSRDEHTSMATRSQEWLEDWRSAWMEKRIDAYIDHYDESFESLGMNRSQWRSFKDRLNRTYQTIDVRLSRPKFLVHGNRAVVRFLQQYQSDQVQDFGEKTLYLRRRSPQGPWKIVSEQWQKETDPQAIAEMAKTVAAHQGR